MKPITILKILSLSTLIFTTSCKEDDTQEDQLCYRCILEMSPQTQTICNTDIVYEICELRPHESSLQSYIEIKETCDGQTETTEEIRFIEEILAEQRNVGAICEEF